MNKGGGVSKLEDAFIEIHGKKANAKERKEFFNWLFDHISEFRVKSKNELANQSIKRYENEFNVLLNKDWVYSIMRLGIYRDGSELRFESNISYSFNDLCEHPTITRKL